MANALALAQEVARRVGISVPSSLVSTDTDGQQMLALMNELGAELATRFRWQQLVKEVSFTTVANTEQGTLSTILQESANTLISLTIWDETSNLWIEGPLSDSEFFPARDLGTGPQYEYKIFNDKLFILPTPPAGNTLRMFVRSSKWARSSAGAAKELLSADEDYAVFADELMRLGLRWKWREEKGLPYAEIQRSFEAMAADLSARSASGRRLYMGQETRTVSPGIAIRGWNTIP